MPDSPATRAAFLRDRVETSREQGGPTSDVPFRQKVHDLHRIQVPIDFPLYNLQSGRSHRAQSRYIEENGLPEDFFADPESDAAQEGQHALLIKMIDEKNLQNDLEEKDQRRPLVLTYDGFIVDGNRRTAALRELGGVEQLDAVVLPKDALASEIYETELELQMAVETKASYNWVDEGIHVRHGIRDLEEDKEAIARRMNQAIGDVEEILDRMTLVDLYLDWLGTPGRYHRVGEVDEQSFEELRLRERRAQFKNLSDLHQRAVRSAVFAVIQAHRGYQDVRKVADHMIDELGEVARRFREEELTPEVLALLDKPISTGANSPDDGGLLEELVDAGGDPPPPAGVELLNVVESPPETTEVAETLARVAEDLAELERERREQDAPLRKLKRVLRTLEGTNLSQETPRKSEIAQVLAELIDRAELLAQSINQPGSDNGD